MREIKAEHRSPAEFAMTKFWKRKDTLVVAGGSIPCIRELYILAKEMDKLSQFRYVNLTEEEYVLGSCEDKIRRAIVEGAAESGAQVVIFYLSCLDILVRLDFRDMEESLSAETGTMVRCFYRGPLGKEEKDRVDADTFLASLPEEKGRVKPGTSQMPPPVSDGAAISDWMRQKGRKNILVTPAGCRSCMADLDMMEDQREVYYPSLEGKDFIFGMEDKTIRETDELMKDGPSGKAALIGTAVPSFMGMDGDMVAKEIQDKGHPSLYFDADGFHDGLYGLSRAELSWAKFRMNRAKRKKGKVVEILGYSPLLCGYKKQYEKAAEFFSSLGYEMVFSGEWEGDSLPALNWCVSAAGIPAGRWMEKVMGIPLLISHPLGNHAFENWKKRVQELLEEGKGERTLHIHNMSLEETRKEPVLFIGDPVRMMGAAHYLWHRGFHHVKIAVPAWTGETEKLALSAPGAEFIETFSNEKEWKELAEDYDFILGDPWYEPLCPSGRFIALPWGGVSGRSYKDGGVPLGEDTERILDSI